MIRGSFAKIERIPQEVAEKLFAAAAELDLMPATAQDIAQVKQAKLQSYNGTGSVIEAFNGAHKVRDLLAQYGYTAAPHGGRLSRPGQPESAGVSVVDGDNVAFAWSSNDPLHRPNGSGNPLPIDPFDVFAFFEHHDDKKAATKAAAKLLGMVETHHAAGATTSEAASPVSLSLGGVVEAIKAFAGDTTAILREVGPHIGALSSSEQLTVVDALVDAGMKTTNAKELVRACHKDFKQSQRAALRAETQAERAARKNSDAIQVNDRQLSDLMVDAEQALIEYNGDKPKVFVRGGALVRIAQDEEGHGIKAINQGALLGTLADAAEWVTIAESDKGDRVTAVSPPSDVVVALINRPAWNLPKLNGLVSAPVFDRNGVLQAAPGYNPSTGLYNIGNLELGDTRPLPNNIGWANARLLDLLHDFPFVDDASKAHAIAYIIAPFVRDMISGPVPPTLVDAPVAGTGKGLLVNACAMPFLGVDVPSMPAANNDDEWRKRITTALMRGQTHVNIDNVNTELDSGALATAWTQAIWQDRLLGSNNDTNIPIKTIWAITANNVKMSQELARRVVWIRLDANSERPWARQGFRHDNLIEWVKENRSNLVTAVVILVNAWLEAGRPLFTAKAKGSYEEWTRIVGGIVTHAGYTDFLGNEDALYDAAAVTTNELQEFVKAWAEKQAQRLAAGYDACLPVKELFKLASVSDDDKENQLGEYKDLLGYSLGAGNRRSRLTRLGLILAENREKVIAGFKVKFEKHSGNDKFWRLEQAQGLGL